MLPNFNYVQARDLREAVRLLASEGARVHAGGTDLLGCLRDGVFGAQTVVSLAGIADLGGLREGPVGERRMGALHIGALTSVAAVASSPVVRERYRALAQAADSVGSPQLRNQGTIGGNLCQKPRCWYYRGEFDCLRKGGAKCFAVAGQNAGHCILGGSDCFIVHPSDTAPALVVFEASVGIDGPKGERSVPIEEFPMPPSRDPQRETVLEQGEVVTGIEIPPPPAGCRSSYRKVRTRQSWDFALAGMALALNVEGGKITRARVALSGAAPIPWRSKEAEEVLTGAAVGPEIAKQAGIAAMKGARPLAKNGYKVRLFQGLIETELLKAFAAG
jgi:xanthine dehydrogenase YagS FAD-binding subunit